MPPLIIRSRPGMRFPACPTCHHAVTHTETREARAAVPHDMSRYYATTAPEPGETGRLIFYTGEPVPTGHTDVGGAPDRDIVQAHPCGCTLRGHRAHQYLTDAIQLTYPDVHVQIRVTIPGALLDPPADLPAVLHANTHVDIDDVIQSQARGKTPIAAALLSAADQILAALPETRPAPPPQLTEETR